MPRNLRLLSCLACLTGVLISLRDVAAIGDDAPMLTVLLLIVCAGIFGLVRPGRAWQWAVLIGVWPVVVHLGAHGLGVNDHFQSNSGAARTALLPISMAATFAGAYSGVFARHILLSSEDSRR